jgi:hypothetical protein
VATRPKIEDYAVIAGFFDSAAVFVAAVCGEAV